MSARTFSLVVLAVFVASFLLTACSPQGSLPAPLPARQAASRLDVAVTTLATAFVPNPGIGDPAILFRTMGAGGLFYFGLQEVLLPLPSPGGASPLSRAFAQLGRSGPAAPPEAAVEPAFLRVRFEGADPAVQVTGEDLLTGVVNYLIGDDPTRWRTAIPTYGRVVYRGLYPGIDLTYTGAAGALKGTFSVAAGADPGLIGWRYEGAAAAQVHDGELRVTAPGGDDKAFLVERRPEAWQVIAGRRVSVSVNYRQLHNGAFGFDVGRYDPSQPLIIDPTLEYGTYWGFSGCEGAYHVAVDGTNKVYIVGATNVASYPAQTTDCDQLDYYDIFVTKLDPTQSGAQQLIYTTYLAGNALDLGVAVQVDAAGAAYVGGYSWSDNFPTTAQAYQNAFGGGSADAIAAKLDAQGAPVYVTYLGGSASEEAYDMAAAGGLIYLVGATSSADFPTTTDAYQGPNQRGDGFIAVLDSASSGASSLVYSTFYGGTEWEEIDAVAVANGVIYFAGTTYSQDLPLQNPIYSSAPSAPGYGDGFAAKLDRTQMGAAQLRFATYLGGNKSEMFGGVAVDATGRMYLTGLTLSTDYPRTTGPAFGGGEWDGVLTALNPDPPTGLVYSRFVGGNGKDALRDVLVTANGAVYVVGGTGSSDLPTVNPLQSDFRGGAAQAPYTWLGSAGDALIAAFDNSGAMTFGTYLGGTGFDTAMGLALGADGKVYIAGGTYSTDLTTANPYHNSNAGKYDAFVFAIVMRTPGPAHSVYLPLVLR